MANGVLHVGAGELVLYAVDVAVEPAGLAMAVAASDLGALADQPGPAFDVDVARWVGVLALRLDGIAGLAGPGIWVLTVYGFVGVVMNGISRSRYERFTMTPVALVMAVSCLVVALNG